MPTAVTGILIALAVIALIGGFIIEVINRICVVLMSIIFIITALIIKQQITQPFLVNNNTKACVIFVLIYAAIGALFTVPFLLPGVIRSEFSIGNIVFEMSDYRASLGFCLMGIIAGIFISAPCISAFADGGAFIFFILPAIIIGVINLIYSIILFIGYSYS